MRGGRRCPRLTHRKADQSSDDERCAGSGLAAYFVKAVLDRSIPMETGVDVKELIGDGERVVGVRADDSVQIFKALRNPQTVQVTWRSFQLDPTRPRGQRETLEASLGAKFDLPTLDGDEVVVVPPGTQPGREFVLRQRGVPRLHGRGRGDLRVRIDVQVPTKLSDAEADLLRA